MNLKTTLLSGIFLLLFIITPNVNAQLTYTGPFSNDFMNPTPLTLGPGINTISNEFTTPPTYQAWFEVDLPAGLIITNVTFAVNGADATGSSGLMCWNPFSSCNPSDTWNGDQVATSITTWQTPGTLPISSSQE